MSKKNIWEKFVSLFREETVKDDWRLVYTKTLTSYKFNGDDIFVYFHFFESQDGKRRFEFDWTVSTVSVDISDPKIFKDTLRRIEYYHDVVYPWMHGSYIPDIPSYSEMDSVNMAKKLAH